MTPTSFNALLENLNAYRNVPPDYARDIRRETPANFKYLVGDYWTVPVEVSLEDLAGIRTVTNPNRLQSVVDAMRDGVQLPPLEIAVHQDGSGTLIDGNHRLSAARRLMWKFITIQLTFP